MTRSLKSNRDRYRLIPLSSVVKTVLNIRGFLALDYSPRQSAPSPLYEFIPMSRRPILRRSSCL